MVVVALVQRKHEKGVVETMDKNKKQIIRIDARREAAQTELDVVIANISAMRNNVSDLHDALKARLAALDHELKEAKDSESARKYECKRALGALEEAQAELNSLPPATDDPVEPSPEDLLRMSQASVRAANDLTRQYYEETKQCPRCNNRRCPQ